MLNTFQIEDTEISIYIGLFLKNKRKEVGLTGAQLASRLSISQQQISRYERGKNTITIQGLLGILQALELHKSDMDEFIRNIFSFYYVNTHIDTRLIN